MTTLFCIDFDETLSNTDRLRADIIKDLRRIGGDGLTDAYLEAYEGVREKHGTIRMPLVLQAMAEQAGVDFEMHCKVADLLHGCPYQDYIYAGAEATIARLKEQGQVVILSDGDAFFQPQKIYTTSVAKLVDAVIVLPSKTDYFDDIAGYWPAEQYVFIDDKQRVLDAAKMHFGTRATTVLIRQGRYAETEISTAADLSVATIAEVATLAVSSLRSEPQ